MGKLFEYGSRSFVSLSAVLALSTHVLSIGCSQGKNSKTFDSADQGRQSAQEKSLGIEESEQGQFPPVYDEGDDELEGYLGLASPDVPNSDEDVVETTKITRLAPAQSCELTNANPDEEDILLVGNTCAAAPCDVASDIKKKISLLEKANENLDAYIEKKTAERQVHIEAVQKYGQAIEEIKKAHENAAGNSLTIALELYPAAHMLVKLRKGYKIVKALKKSRGCKAAAGECLEEIEEELGVRHIFQHSDIGAGERGATGVWLVTRANTAVNAEQGQQWLVLIPGYTTYKKFSDLISVYNELLPLQDMAQTRVTILSNIIGGAKRKKKANEAEIQRLQKQLDCYSPSRTRLST